MKYSFAIVVFALFIEGCASLSDNNSLTLPAALVNITAAPLSGDFRPISDVSELKCGESDEIVYFMWPYPPIDLVTVGDDALKSAMRNGGIKEVYFADYEQKHYLIVAFYKVRVYGR